MKAGYWRDSGTSVLIGIIHNSQDKEITWLFITEWMDKEDLREIYIKYYSALRKKEVLPFATTWMDVGTLW